MARRPPTICSGPSSGGWRTSSAKLGEKYGDLTGRLETKIRPDDSFDDVGGLRPAKALLRGFAIGADRPRAATSAWGIAPPRGALLYGPPGTGKAMLARALAGASQAIFFRLRLGTSPRSSAPTPASCSRRSLRIAISEGRAVLLLMDEVDALSLEHLLPPPQAREASARLVAALCEKLDAMDASARVLVVGSTSRTDALDPALVAPGRLDHLIEVPLPDSADAAGDSGVDAGPAREAGRAHAVRADRLPHGAAADGRA